MKDNYGWSQQQVEELIRLVKTGNILNKDIAEKLGKKPASVSFKLRRLGLKNTAAKKVIGKWNIKHAHLREKVMTYFLTHTNEETAKKFNLTKSELKSIFTIGYRLPQFKHLRKDTRRHDAWSTKEYKFLLQHSGLKSRDWIAKKLNRGGELVIKDRLDLLGVSSVTLNGLTISKFRDAFGKNPEFYLQTEAGPKRQLKHKGNSCSFYKIVPWVWLDKEIKLKRLKTHAVFSQLIESMAIFQEWYFEGNALKKLKKICKDHNNLNNPPNQRT